MADHRAMTANGVVLFATSAGTGGSTGTSRFTAWKIVSPRASIDAGVGLANPRIVATIVWMHG